jgi:hypothetical protein
MHIGGINWPETPIRYLGIHICHEEKAAYKCNWENKLETLQKLLDSWRKRKLTIFGKITILKSSALSKLTYVASMLPLPYETVKLWKQFVMAFGGEEERELPENH